MRNAWRSIAVLGALGTALVGCAGGGGGGEPMRVEVRTADDRPAAGVAVRVVPSNPTHPFRVSDYVRGFDFGGEHERTDEQGVARVSGPPARPSRLIVLSPEFGAESVWLGETAEEAERQGWQAVPVGAGSGAGGSGGGGLKVRVSRIAGG
jgi:hypothetical protein